MINPFNKKKGLGRGLSSLIGDNEVTKNNNFVSISSIITNKFQPRKKFDQHSLEDLTKSIKEECIVLSISGTSVNAETALGSAE